MIQTETELDQRLSEPTPEVVATMRRLEGDIVVLGVAGKMGPTLARMARRASDEAGVKRHIWGVSRFSSEDPKALEAHGIGTIRCDLLDPDQVAQLPDAANVIYMAGRKFGSTGDESTTWAHNSFLPGLICQKYRGSKIVAFSTLNVYGLVPSRAGRADRRSDARWRICDELSGTRANLRTLRKQIGTRVQRAEPCLRTALWGARLARLVWEERPVRWAWVISTLSGKAMPMP